MRRKTVSLLVIVLAIFVVLGIIPILQSQFGVSYALEFQKGIHYVTWNKKAYGSENSEASIAKIASLGANWIAILTTWYQKNCFSTEIKPTDKTPTDESLIKAINAAHANNLKVMIKPHLDILDDSYGGWRGEITCAKEPDWDKWFEAYKNYIMHYAKMASEHKVEMLCIGTELTEATLTKPERWRKLIKEIRKVYKGLLTYAANWNEEYLGIVFWDALDYAGVDAYFPLSDKEDPSYNELMESWKKWLAEIEKWQAKIKKPVIFPEIGYHSAGFAAKEPWSNAGMGAANPELQVNCYKAMFDTFMDKEWFYGIYLWDWGTSVKMGNRGSKTFTPQNKPAEETIKEYFNKKK